MSSPALGPLRLSSVLFPRSPVLAVVQGGPADAGQAGARNGAIDLTRLMAAFGIVLFHSGAPGGWFGYAALPLFLILMLVLAAPAAERGNVGTYAQGRARRLLGPWLVWSGIYGALKLAEIAAGRSTVATEFAPSMILTGPAIHLWFLPFAFAACLITFAVVRAARTQRPWWTLGLAVAALATPALSQGDTLPIPLAQWADVLPALMLGLMIAINPDPRRGAGLALVAALGMFGIGQAMGWQDTPGQTLLAMAAAALCLWIRLPSTALTRRIGDLALTVYLAHPLVISVLLRVTDLPEGSLTLALAVAVGTLALAVAIAALRPVRAEPALAR